MNRRSLFASFLGSPVAAFWIDYVDDVPLTYMLAPHKVVSDPLLRLGEQSHDEHLKIRLANLESLVIDVWENH